LGAGCGAKKAYIRSAKQVERDFYTCKGFKGGHPVDATSEFSVNDGLVYVVADLEKEQVGSRLDFEVEAPTGKIAYFESVKYNQDRPYGIYFDAQKLVERGGSGDWKVLFWADVQPMGYLTFNLEGPPGAERVGGESAQTGNIFDRLLGEEGRPLEMPSSAPEEASPVVETPEGVVFTPGEIPEATAEMEPAMEEMSEPAKEVKEQP